MRKGLLIVVSAPSGCGKGTILSEVLKQDDFFYSVSATTRQPRPGEENGVHYHFLTKDDFQSLVQKNGMLEYAEYCENYYGTPRKAVEDQLLQGKNVVLEIEVQGAMKIRKSFPEAVFIFILPPTIDELRDRLEKRGTETSEVIQKRIDEAEQEIKMAVYYDYWIVNNKLEVAVDDFIAIIRSEKLKKERMQCKLDEVLNHA